VIEDRRIPSFPNVPEEQHDVRSGLFREKESAPKDPRHAELAGERNMIQAMPNLTGTRALEEDVCVCFKEIRAQLTSGIFRGAQIPAEQVRTCVQAPMVKQPAEEFDFVRETYVPNERGVSGQDPWGVQGAVGTGGGENLSRSHR